MATCRSKRKARTGNKKDDPDDIKLPKDGNGELLESWCPSKRPSIESVRGLAPTQLLKRRPVLLHALGLGGAATSNKERGAKRDDGNCVMEV